MRFRPSPLAVVTSRWPARVPREIFSKPERPGLHNAWLSGRANVHLYTWSTRIRAKIAPVHWKTSERCPGNPSSVRLGKRLQNSGLLDLSRQINTWRRSTCNAIALHFLRARIFHQISLRLLHSTRFDCPLPFFRRLKACLTDALAPLPSASSAVTRAQSVSPPRRDVS